MIALPLIKGDPRKSLARPDCVVISERAALKHFGTTDAVGKTMTIDGISPKTVTAFLKVLPYNTQFTGDVFERFPIRQVLSVQSGSAPMIADIDTEKWTIFDVSNYIHLAPETSP